MANPEYENKVSPTELYNDEIIQQFEAIRQVIHKEILPSTYNELIVTSNQAGTLTNYMDLKSYPQSEIIFPLSPQSGTINWLDKNYLRFHFSFKETLESGQISFLNSNIAPKSYWSIEKATGGFKDDDYCCIGPIDGASIFKSLELNYGGTSIWTSAYQQVEAFATFTSLPGQITSSSTQYWTIDKTIFDYPWSSGATVSDTKATTSVTLEHEFYIDIDISRLSPILSWLSLIPSFCNKLTLRCIIDAPWNWLIKRTYGSIQSEWPPCNNVGCSYIPLCKTTDCPCNIKWRCDLCEIHQNNATMTEDTRIRLIALIQQIGGKWIYPCRYWNTSLAPIQTIASSSNGYVNLQFVLTGCYFRALTFMMQPVFSGYDNLTVSMNPGNGIFFFPQGATNYEVYADSELLVSYSNPIQMITDTTSALMDEDKYCLPLDVIRSLRMYNALICSYGRTAFTIATGPPNGLYSGKYTSEKMGTHNILLKFKLSGDAPSDFNLFAWCSALQDGVIVFDNFNGSYFNTARRMQQVYEALT